MGRESKTQDIIHVSKEVIYPNVKVIENDKEEVNKKDVDKD